MVEFSNYKIFNISGYYVRSRYMKVWLSLSLIAVNLLTSCSNDENRTYTIARSASWEGIDAFGSEQNLLGFSDDLLLEVAKTAQFNVQLINVEIGALTHLLQDEDIDAILTGIQPTPQTMKKYLFSDPYFYLGPVLVVRADSPFDTLEDLNNREVAYVRGSPTAFKLAGASKCIFHPYDDMIRGLDALRQGLVDGALMDALEANRYVIGLYKGVIRIAGPPLIPMGLYLVAKKKLQNRVLIELFNKGLKKVKQQGLYKKMLFYWDLYDSEHPYDRFEKNTTIQ